MFKIQEIAETVFKDVSEDQDSVNWFLCNKAVSRTALASPGL